MTKRIDHRLLWGPLQWRGTKTNQLQPNETATIADHSEEQEPEFLGTEIRNVVKELRPNKISSHDRIKNEQIKQGDDKLVETLTAIYNTDKILKTKAGPGQWKFWKISDLKLYVKNETIIKLEITAPSLYNADDRKNPSRNRLKPILNLRQPATTHRASRQSLE